MLLAGALQAVPRTACALTNVTKCATSQGHRYACRDELRDDDIALKLNSIRRLGTIALALGDERTRSELLPYLLESKPDEDELMEALAEEVGKLVPCVGGPPHAHTLVPLLEELARQDETVVRDAAVRALQKVGAEFGGEQVMAHLVPTIQVRADACVRDTIMLAPSQALQQYVDA